jgi:hypothetical protein
MVAIAPAPADLPDDVAALKHFDLTQAAHYESMLALLREQGEPVRASSPRLLPDPDRCGERSESGRRGWAGAATHGTEFP